MCVCVCVCVCVCYCIHANEVDIDTADDESEKTIHAVIADSVIMAIILSIMVQRMRFVLWLGVGTGPEELRC